MMSTIAGAADVDMVLVSPQDPAQERTLVTLDLYLVNNTDTTIAQELPQTLPCRIDTGQTTVTVNAVLDDPQVETRLEIPGRGFVKRQYTVTLPVFATGTVQIKLEGHNMNPLSLPVEKVPPETWVGQQVPLDEGFTMLQFFLDDLSVYEPMYFLLGVDPGLDQSKFQFSFKYRLFDPEGYFAEKVPWISDFHLAYTQQTIWDLRTDSMPFDDTSYMPELFYLLPKFDLHIDRISAFGIQGGFQHLSNGKDGDESRSTNHLYVKPVMGLHLTGPYHLKIAPKFFTYVDNDNETNKDLVDFIGYFDLELGLLNPDGIALTSHLWWAKNGATVQFDLTYPLTRLLGKSMNLYLHAQYFSGYAETLLHYNQRHNAFRLGFSIVR